MVWINTYLGNLSSAELTLEVTRKRFKDFCKPQANEVRARFDLLTSIWEADRSIGEWCNAVQMQVALAKYLQETVQILQRDIFQFFLNDESFVSKTLNEGYVELSKFPASTVCQLAKKLESSQDTTKHIKQVTRDPQAEQVHLLQHQHIEIPTKKKKHKSFKFRQAATKHFEDVRQQVQKKFDPECTKSDRCNRCGDSLDREGLDVQ